MFPNKFRLVTAMHRNGPLPQVYCPTDDMTADTLTKALPSVKAKHFAAALGLTTV